MKARTLWFTALLAAAIVPLAGARDAWAGNAPGGAKDDATAAKEHYKRGTTLYDLNRFDEAVKEFEAAYELKDDPVLLYNIAQSYRLANKYPEALRFYRNYLRRSPKAPNRAEVEQKIEDMEKLINEQNRVATAAPDSTIAPGTKPTGTQPTTPATRPPTTPPPTTPPPPTRVQPTTPPPSTEPTSEPDDKPAVATRPQPTPNTQTPPPRTKPTTPVAQTPPPRKADDSSPASPGKGKLIAGVVIGVVGLAAVGAGVAFGMMAKGAADDLSKAPVYDSNLESKGKLDNTLAIAMMAGGGAVAAVGIGVAVWGAMQKPEKARSSHNLQVVPAVGKDYAGGALHLSF